MAEKPRTLRFIKYQISRIETKSKDCENMTAHSLRHYLDELETCYSDFCTFYDTDEFNAELGIEFDEYDSKYESAKSALLTQIEKIAATQSNEYSHRTGEDDQSLTGILKNQNELMQTLKRLSLGTGRNDHGRLPYLKIPIFRGDLKEWTKFKNLFSSIVDANDNLSDTEKLNHLLSVVEGEPLALIKHYPITGDNNANAWGILKNEYDNDYVLIRSLINEIVGAPVIDNKRGSLRNLWSLLTETIQALDNMGEYGKTRDPWIIYTIVNKLDRRTAKEWSKLVVEDSEPDVGTLINFLREQSSSEMLMGESTQQKIFEPRKPLKGMTATMIKCFVCGEQHNIFKCSRFLRLSVKERELMVKRQSRCINCLGYGHQSTKCLGQGSCFHCRKRHHTLLHYNSVIKNESKLPSKAQESSDEDKALLKINLSISNKLSSAILPTAVVEVLDGSGRFIKCRILLDSGAQASFTTESFFRRLMLRRSRTKVPIQFMSGTASFYSKGAVNTLFRSRHDSGKTCSVSLHILPKLMDNIPEQKLRFDSIPNLKRKFQLADDDFDIPGNIDVIIGADHFFGIIGPGKYFHQTDKVWVLESSLGWLISGGTEDIDNHGLAVNSICQNSALNEFLERFWCLDEQSHVSQPNDDDSRCEEIFSKTTVRMISGRYSVDLPFKEPKMILGESYTGALHRFHALENKFQRNSLYKLKYCGLMKLFEDEGYIERVPNSVLELPTTNRFYLPHYGIGKKGEGSDKLRIVFDASAKSDNGISLNDCVLSGPKYQTEIFSILCKFRLHKYVFTTDIIKMYRQININSPFTDFQRILWRSNEQEPIQHWRLLTLMDGVNAAPYLALRTLEQLALDESDNFPNGAIALKNRYMDDFFIGSDSLEETVSIRDELIAILQSAGMKLDKWASNDERILEGISESERLLERDFEVECDVVMKTLGVNWNPKCDFFTFSITPLEITKFTRRSLVADSAKIFDPCGWISPVTVSLKALFQKTWLDKLGWDEPLPNSVKESWLKVRLNLDALRDVEIPRWIGINHNAEIHGFCDSSLMAYAAVVYLRGIDRHGMISTKIIASRTKLCPLKQVSIARLELCGAQLLAKLMVAILPIFGKLEPSYFCWTDSKTVIAWLASHPSRWKTFVGNRCALIHEMIPNIPWRYVKSELNPADLASRGMTPEKLIGCDLWWTGPSWLLDDWRHFYVDQEVDTCEEVMPVKINEVVIAEPSFLRFVERFSSFERFTRSFAYFLRFVNIIVTKTADYSPLTSEDISKSTSKFIFILQRHEFRDSFDVKDSTNFRAFGNLSPFIDDSGLVRVGGRLSNIAVSYEAKHPLLIPKGHFLNLLVRWVHEKYYHPGLRLTLSLMKQRFYVSRMRNYVKKVISECVICAKFRAKTYDPKMAELPALRFEFNKPFEVSGVDFAGPVCVRPYRGRGRMTMKGYICVIVCMATRAIDLELVTNLDTESLIFALRRFVSRYGYCRKMLSDNGRNFVGCARVFAENRKIIEKLIASIEVKNFLLKNQIDWKFIPPYSPHFGGMWESSVKSVKHHLSRMFSGKTLILEEMQTALLEISSILNSRPLSVLSEDIEDLEPLTPSHFLTGRCSVCLPILSQDRSSSNVDPKGNTHIASLVRLFWKKWKNEYLQGYMKRVKWQNSGRCPEVGDLVVVKRPNSHPGHWITGRIVNLLRSVDETIRVVEIRTADGVRKESVRNLVPILLKQ